MKTSHGSDVGYLVIGLGLGLLAGGSFGRPAAAMTCARSCAAGPTEAWVI